MPPATADGSSSISDDEVEEVENTGLRYCEKTSSPRDADLESVDSVKAEIMADYAASAAARESNTDMAPTWNMSNVDESGHDVTSSVALKSSTSTSTSSLRPLDTQPVPPLPPLLPPSPPPPPSAASHQPQPQPLPQPQPTLAVAAVVAFAAASAPLEPSGAPGAEPEVSVARAGSVDPAASARAPASTLASVGRPPGDSGVSTPVVVEAGVEMEEGYEDAEEENDDVPDECRYVDVFT
jgi:hypothetical protein